MSILARRRALLVPKKELVLPPSSTYLPAKPTPPPFNPTTAVQITAGQNVASIVAAGAAGTQYRLLAGAHNINDVQPKTGDYIRGDDKASVTASGAGKNFAFRAPSGGADDVTIGGINLTGYGVVSYDTSQQYGAIMCQPSVWSYASQSGWFVHDMILHANGGGGVYMGHHMTVIDSEITGHNVCGIQGDGGVGGLIGWNYIRGNTLNPAGGSSANGAAVKLVWWNGGTGRSIGSNGVPAPARCWIVMNDVDGSPLGSTAPGQFGLWGDLDCHDMWVNYNTLRNFVGFGIFFEGSNDCKGMHNTLVDCTGYGENNGDAAWNSLDFKNAALSAGESSNIEYGYNHLTNAGHAFMIRLSDRNDFDDFNYIQNGHIVDSWAAIAPSAQSNLGVNAYHYHHNTHVNCGKGGQSIAAPGTKNPPSGTYLTNANTATHSFHDNIGLENMQLWRDQQKLTHAQWLAAGWS